MNRICRFRIVALLPLLTASGCGAISKVDLWRLITSGRDGYQQPEMVIEALDVQSGATVAEIGAGDGYWLPWLSKAVGKDGKVYAVEVEADMIEPLRQLIDDEGLSNVEVVLGRYEDPLLPDGSVDLAITSKTYHHIEERVAYFQRLRDDLVPSGRVAHLDDRPDLPFPLSWITAGHTSDPAMIEAEMTEAGYRRLAEFDFIYSQSFLVYEPVGPAKSSNRPRDDKTVRTADPTVLPLSRVVAVGSAMRTSGRGGIFHSLVGASARAED